LLRGAECSVKSPNKNAKKPIKEGVGASCAIVKLPKKITTKSPNKIRAEVCALMMLLKPIQIIEPPHFAKCGGKRA
jgi:hypothetical protein